MFSMSREYIWVPCRTNMETPSQSKLSRLPDNTAMTQQQLPACQLYFSATMVFSIFFASGLFCLSMGILLILSAKNIQKIEVCPSSLVTGFSSCRLWDCCRAQSVWEQRPSSGHYIRCMSVFHGLMAAQSACGGLFTLLLEANHSHWSTWPYLCLWAFQNRLFW